MILAIPAVYVCILTSLWFNGSYAWSKGGAFEHQLAMVALALAIDFAKCSFLVGASHLWAQGWRLPPAVLVVLWLPCLIYSGFTAYASISVNRSQSTIADITAATNHATAEATYNRLTATLATAKTSSNWQQSRACTNPRNKRQRAYCAKLNDLTTELAVAATALTTARPATIEPELQVLQATFAWPMTTLTLMVSLFPALVLELIASLGLYAVHRPRTAKVPQNAAKAVSTLRQAQTAKAPQNAGRKADNSAHSRPAPAPTKVTWGQPSR